MSAEAAYLSIPGWPGYMVNRLGQVRSDHGVLACDCKGRVRLRDKASKRYNTFPVGALMEMAGLLTESAGSPDPALEDELIALRRERDTLERHVAGLREEMDKAAETIARGRKLNGHLLALARRQKAQLAALTAPRKGRKPVPEYPEAPEELNFDHEELP